MSTDNLLKRPLIDRLRTPFNLYEQERAEKELSELLSKAGLSEKPAPEGFALVPIDMITYDDACRFGLDVKDIRHRLAASGKPIAPTTEKATKEAEDAALWRQHQEIVRIGGFPDALTMRLTLRQNEKSWQIEYVLDSTKFGRNTALGIKAIGIAAEQKAEELFAAMGAK